VGAARAGSPDPDLLAARRHPALRQDADPDARRAALRRWAELEAKSGNHELACRAAGRFFHEELAGAWRGSKSLDDAPAPTSLRESARYVLAISESLPVCQPVLDAAGWLDSLSGTEVATLRRNLLAYSYHGGRYQPWADALVGGDPSWQAWLDNGRGRDTALAVATLGRLGDLGVSMLGSLLDNAVAGSAWAEAKTIARRIVAADRWHMRARLLLGVLDDIEAGRVRLADKDLRKLLGATLIDDGLLWRLHAAVGTTPTAHGLALAVSDALRGKRLIVDARRLAEAALREPQLRAELKDGFRAELALMALATEDVSSYRAWADANGRLQSDSLGHEELRQVYALDKLGPERRSLVVERLKAVLAADEGPTTCTLQALWASPLAFDDSVPGDLRSRAQQILARSQPARAKALSLCLAQGGTWADCKERDEFFASADDDDGEVPETIPKQVQEGKGLTYPELEVLVGLPLSDQKKMKRALKAQSDGAWSETPAALASKASLLFGQGKLAELRALLAADGGRIERELRLSLRLALLDPRARHGANLPKLDRLSRLAPFTPRTHPAATSAAFQDEQDDSSDDDEADGSLGIAGRMTQAWYGGDARQLLALTNRVWMRLDGAEGAEIAARVYLAADALANSRLRKRAFDRAKLLAPLSDVARILEAHERQRAGDKAGAFRAWRDAYLADPESERLLQAMLLAGAELTPSATITGPNAQAWVAHSLRERHESFGDLGLHDSPSATELRSLFFPVSHGDAFLDNLVGPEQPAQTWRVRELLRTSAGDAKPELLRRLVAYLSTTRPSSESRRLLVWCQALLGDLPAMRKTLAQPVSMTKLRLSRQGSVEPVPDDDVLRLLASLEEMPDAPMRWQIFQHFEEQRQDARDTPALLASLAGQKKGDAGAWRTLACVAAGVKSRAEETLTLCKDAWKAGVRNSTVAAYLAWAIVQNPSAAASASFDAAGFFAEAQKRPSAPHPGSLLHYHSLYLAKMGRVEDAVRAEKAAWSEAGYVGSPGMLLEEFPLTHFAPLLYRLRLAAGQRFPDTNTHAAIAMGGFMAGDFPLTVGHAREAVRLHPPVVAGTQGEDPFYDMALLMRDLVEVAEVDLREKRTTETAVTQAFVRLVRPRTSTPEKDHLEWPNSFFFTALAADAPAVTKQLPEAKLRELDERFPRNVLVQSALFRHHIVVGDRAKAAALSSRLKSLAPNDPRLRMVMSAGADAGTLPPELESPQAMARAFDDVDVEPELAKPWVHKFSEEDGVEVFLPADATPETNIGVTAVRNGVRLLAAQQPNVGRCEPMVCMREIVKQLGAQSMSQLWAGPVVSPLGEGARALVRTAAGLLWIELYTTPKQLHFLMAGGSPSDLRSSLAMLRLWRDSFRPIDTVMRGDRRAAFLNHTPARADDVMRVRARTLLARAQGEGCPVRSVLSRLPGTRERAFILQDLFLASPLASDRRRILACVNAGQDSAALALPALLDPDTEIRDRADGLMAKRGWEWLPAIKAIAELDPHRAAVGRAAPSLMNEEIGLLQILVHLGAQDRRALTRHFLASGQSRLRAAAIMAESLAPGGLSDSDIQEILGSGSVEDVERLAEAIPRLSKEQRDALEVRIGSNTASTEGHALATALTRWSERPPAPEMSYEQLPGPGGKQVSTLSTQDLPRLLPGSTWVYARIDKPRAWATSVDALLRRLDLTRHPSARLWVTALQEQLATSEAIKAKLDLDLPFECARSSDADRDTVCSVYSSDVSSLRKALLASCGKDMDGLRTPLKALQGASDLSQLSRALPWIFLDETATADAPDGRPRECAYRQIRFGALTIDQLWLLDPERRQRGTGSRPTRIDTFLAFAGHRAFAANRLETLQAILTADQRPRMASLPGFASQSQVWRDSSAFHVWSSKRNGGATEETNLMLAAGDTSFKITGRTSIEGKGKQAEGKRDDAPRRGDLHGRRCAALCRQNHRVGTDFRAHAQATSRRGRASRLAAGRLRFICPRLVPKTGRRTLARLGHRLLSFRCRGTEGARAKAAAARREKYRVLGGALRDTPERHPSSLNTSRATGSPIRPARQ
jgi:hypothetical protein